MSNLNEKDTKELLHGWASRTAARANAEAKTATGWRKWLWAVGAIVAGAVAWFTTGCTASYTQNADGSFRISATVGEVKECK